MLRGPCDESPDVVAGVDHGVSDVKPDKTEHLVLSSVNVFCRRVLSVAVAAFDVGASPVGLFPFFASPIEGLFEFPYGVRRGDGHCLLGAAFR